MHYRDTVLRKVSLRQTQEADDGKVDVILHLGLLLEKQARVSFLEGIIAFSHHLETLDGVNDAKDLEARTVAWFRECGYERPTKSPPPAPGGRSEPGANTGDGK